VTVRRWIAGCALATCVVASCGSDALAPRAARDLAADYELLATAVESGDRAEARSSVRTLLRSVDEFEAAGVIDAERADAIRAAVDQVLADLRVLPAPSPTPSPSIEPSVPAPTVENEASDDGDGHGGWSDGGPGNSGSKGNGKGHGHAKGHDKR
jgi:hypothetical protein